MILRWLRLLALLAVPLAAPGEDRQVLRVGTRPNVPPYEYLRPDGGLDGFCVEVARAVAERKGLALEFRTLSNAEIWQEFDQGRLDLISGAVPTEDRVRTVDFSTPLASIQYCLLVRAGTDGVRSERDLEGRRVLVVRRSHMAAYAGARGLALEELPDYDACLLALAQGRGDAALVPRFTWLHLARRLPLGGLREVSSELYPHRICLAVRKGESALLEKLNEGLYELKASGRLDAIHDRHLGSLERAQVPLATALRRSAFWIVPAFLVVGFAVHLAWTLALGRLVRRRTGALQAELARREAAEAALAHTVEELRTALHEVKQLSGLLPICAGCKKIRDDGGTWQALEGYIGARTEATFSHGLCPDCADHLYPEFSRSRKAPRA